MDARPQTTTIAVPGHSWLGRRRVSKPIVERSWLGKERRFIPASSGDVSTCECGWEGYDWEAHLYEAFIDDIAERVNSKHITSPTRETSL